MINAHCISFFEILSPLCQKQLGVPAGERILILTVNNILKISVDFADIWGVESVSTAEPWLALNHGVQYRRAIYFLYSAQSMVQHGGSGFEDSEGDFPCHIFCKWCHWLLWQNHKTKCKCLARIFTGILVNASVLKWGQIKTRKLYLSIWYRYPNFCINNMTRNL